MYINIFVYLCSSYLYLVYYYKIHSTGCEIVRRNFVKNLSVRW